MNPMTNRVVEKAAIPEREWEWDGSIPSISGGAASTLWKDWSVESALNEAMKRSPMAYAAIAKMMSFCGMVPWHVERRDGAKWVRDDECALAKVLDRPHPVPSFDWSYIVQVLVAHLMAGGSGYLAKITPNGGPFKRLDILMPDKVSVVPDPKNIIGMYQYSNGIDNPTYGLDEIIHIMLPNPAELGSGLGKIQAAGKLIDADLASLTWQKSSLDNGAVASSVVMLEGNPGEQAQLASLKMWNKQMAGGTNARKLWLVYGARDIKQVSQSAVEMDYVNSRKALHQELLSALDVNQEMLKWTADSKFDNMDRAIMDFLVNSVIPMLDTIKRAFNSQIKRDDYPGYRIAYDITEIEPYRAVSMERVKQVKELQGTGMPVTKINEWLGLGMPRFPGDDIPYITQNMFRADTPKDDRDRRERESVGNEL